MCKTIFRSVDCLVGLELMPTDPVLKSYNFNGLNKNAFFNVIIRLNPKSINTMLEHKNYTNFMKNKTLDKTSISCNSA